LFCVLDRDKYQKLIFALKLTYYQDFLIIQHWAKLSYKALKDFLEWKTHLCSKKTSTTIGKKIKNQMDDKCDQRGFLLMWFFY